MQVLLIRHSTAESPDGLPDAQRKLTPTGRERFAQICDELAARNVRPQLILSSPRVRAKETAEILSERLGKTHAPISLVEVRWLGNGYSAEELARELNAHAGGGAVNVIAVIGHQPSIGHAAMSLAGLEDLRMSPGTVVAISFDEQVAPRSGKLQFVLQGDDFD